MYKLGNKRINLWDEPFMQNERMTVELKVLYLYLLSNALSNIAGVYKITDRRILFDLCNQNLNLKELFLQLKKIKKVYRCGNYVIIKDAPLYIKKMTKTVIKEMDNILYELPEKIKTKMKRIHYKYAHLYGEPLYEELMKLGIEKPFKKVKNNYNSLREGENERGNKEDEGCLHNLEVGLFDVENQAEHSQNGAVNGTPSKINQEAAASYNMGIKEAKTIEEAPKEIARKEEAPKEEARKEEKTSDLSLLDAQGTSEDFGFSDPAGTSEDFDFFDPAGTSEDFDFFDPAGTSDFGFSEPSGTSNSFISDEESDEEIERRIKESDSFFENFAEDARAFARKENNIEKMGKIPLLVRASQLPSPAKSPYKKIEKTKEKTNNYSEQELKEIKLFQDNYAKNVFKQFKDAGLYAGVDYTYFYKADFTKGIALLKQRAITVENQKEAYALNTVIENYLEKAKDEKDKGKKCTMAFYKMCDEREYNSCNVIYF